MVDEEGLSPIFLNVPLVDDLQTMINTSNDMSAAPILCPTQMAGEKQLAELRLSCKCMMLDCRAHLNANWLLQVQACCRSSNNR